ncbi:MAG TPA: hypothetical protein VD994_17760 [Prosthecobacter sp.]|nr:hypothetical protein [Prosthecobacter sp.]
MSPIEGLNRLFYCLGVPDSRLPLLHEIVRNRVPPAARESLDSDMPEEKAGCWQDTLNALLHAGVPMTRNGVLFFLLL